MSFKMKIISHSLCLLLLTLCLNIASGDEVDHDLQAIANVGQQSERIAAARRASVALSDRGVQVLPRILKAMDTPNVVLANWYRTVYEKIVSVELAKSQPEFPIKQLRTYVGNPKRQGRSRRLVLKLLDQLEPDFRGQLIPTLLDDPEFRSDAVDVVLRVGDRAKAAKDLKTAKDEYQKAFKHSRDSSQVTRAARSLKSVGVEVNIVEHMGFITRWHLLGPFDAPGTSGFNQSFPPEKKVDLQAIYPGKDDTKIGWNLYETTDQMGQLNLIKAIAPVREAVGYAYTEINSPRGQDVQLRCGADDNISVWVNGEQIFSQLQWLNGTRLDRFSAPARLKKGKNVVLVKICQGPQHKNPAVPNNWSMQLRFCDQSGAAVGLKTMLDAVKE